MKFSPRQELALRRVGGWMNDRLADQVFYLAGPAGTGKSTLARHLVENDDGRWLYAAFTGKAAHVLRQKGCEDAKTIHSLLYKPNGATQAQEIDRLETELALLKKKLEGREMLWDHERRALSSLEYRLKSARETDRPRFRLNLEGSSLADPDVRGVVVDEVSMVDEAIGRDLEEFGKKILVLGDPYQLPPVFGGGYFTNREPDLMLTEVHRHARDSGVLRLATHIREGGSLSSFQQSEDALLLSRRATHKDDVALHAMQADQVIVGLNATRIATNLRHRQLIQRTSPLPYAGDKLICLRNDRLNGLFNGSQWTVLSAEHVDPKDYDQGTIELRLKSDDDGREYEGVVWIHHFIDRSAQLEAMGPGRRELPEFAWGYVITCHKAQGSEWPEVLLIDESRMLKQIDPARWLYTGATRAQQRIVVLTT